MNAVAESIPAPRIRSLEERHVFVFMAALLMALTLAGFVPSSLDKISAVQSGERPPFPLVLHLHAGLMGAWLLLLLTQSALASGGRRGLHRFLGIVGLAMVPVILVTGVWLIQVTWQGLWSPQTAAAMPPQALAETKVFVSNILLLQGHALILFPVLIAWAIAVRRTDPDTHRRLMILGTAVPVMAGLDRLATALGLPTAPLLAWDLVRYRKVHRATWIWLTTNAPFVMATSLLWGSSWWLERAPRLMGMPV
jgi:hypothetical protein